MSNWEIFVDPFDKKYNLMLSLDEILNIIPLLKTTFKNKLKIIRDNKEVNVNAFTMPIIMLKLFAISTQNILIFVM